MRPAITFSVTANISIAAAMVASLALGGCGSTSSTTQGTTSGTTASVYLVQQPNTGTNSVLLYGPGSNGAVTPSATLLPSGVGFVNSVATDSAGQIYVGATATTGRTEILVYAAGSSGAAAPLRTINQGTGFATPVSMTVDSAGSLYVVGDSGSVAVYSATATGVATPTRLISGALTQLSLLQSYGVAVDSTGNLYVSTPTATGGAILQFGPTATGNVAPVRVITGATSNLFYGLALDTGGNVYAVNDNLASAVDSWSIQEFSPTSTGAAAPLKSITMASSNNTIGGGLRIDGAGNIYMIEVVAVGTGASATTSFSLLEYGPSASGTSAPVASFTSTAWNSGGSQLALK